MTGGSDGRSIGGPGRALRRRRRDNVGQGVGVESNSQSALIHLSDKGYYHIHLVQSKAGSLVILYVIWRKILRINWRGPTPYISETDHPASQPAAAQGFTGGVEGAPGRPSNRLRYVQRRCLGGLEAVSRAT